MDGSTSKGNRSQSEGALCGQSWDNFKARIHGHFLRYMHAYIPDRLADRQIPSYADT